MRGIAIVFTLCVLAGCSAGPTLAQLEAEALVTGNWSLVEQREARIAKRQQQGLDCPTGAISVCRTVMSELRCTCASRSNVFMAIGGRR